MENEKLRLTEGWDKVFPQDPGVEHRKVCFHNRYGVTLAADLYRPKGVEGPLPAIAVAGPFGAVKEQASGRYAQELARRGFLTVAFDPSFTGESGGEPRYVASPDINTEDFSAAVDYLVTSDEVDGGRVGILGICGWGGMALSAAAADPRIKATVASTMYDMSRVTVNGYFDAEDTADERRAKRAAVAAQRTADYASGTYALAGGLPDERPEDAPGFVQQYWDFYKTPRGYHPRSLNSNGGWNVTSGYSFLNMPLLAYLGDIDRAVMIVHGEKAHSRYFGQEAFEALAEIKGPQGDNKVLEVVPGATHCDLYDRMDVIPFDHIEAFLREYL